MAKSIKARRRDRSSDADAPGRSDHGPERNGRSGSENGSGSQPARANSKRLSGIRAVAMGREQLEMLIQRPVESVSGLSRSGDGWAVTLEVVELERVPPTTDILATYRVELDENGELMGYDRVNRYYRNQAGGDS